MRSMLHRNTITHSRPMAGATGLEPAASGVTGRRSNQLSYAPRASTRAALLPLAQKGVKHAPVYFRCPVRYDPRGSAGSELSRRSVATTGSSRRSELMAAVFDVVERRLH